MLKSAASSHEKKRKNCQNYTDLLFQVFLADGVPLLHLSLAHLLLLLIDLARPRHVVLGLAQQVGALPGTPHHANHNTQSVPPY